MDSLLQLEIGRIAQEMQLRRNQVEGAVELLLAGYSTAQISRFRKEKTGALPDDFIRAIARRLRQVKNLFDRRDSVRKLAESRNALTEELAKRIEEADTLIRLDDLSVPFRPRKNSFAEESRQKGLEPLADAIWQQSDAVGEFSETLAGMVDADKGLATVEDVMTGVTQLISERIFEHSEARAAARAVLRKGVLSTRLIVEEPPRNPNRPPEGQPKSLATEPDQSAVPTPSPTPKPTPRRAPSLTEYKPFARFSEPLATIAQTKVLTINRGERHGYLAVDIDFDRAAFQEEVRNAIGVNAHKYASVLETALPLALDHIAMFLIQEVREELTDKAEEHAAHLAARTVRNILMQRGIGAKRVLAIDPGHKTGCRYAILDETGALLEKGVVYPFVQRRKRKKKKKKSLLTEASMEQQAERWLNKLVAEENQAAAQQPSVFSNADGVLETPAGTSAESTSSEATPSADESLRVESPESIDDRKTLPADSFYRATSADGEEPEANGTDEPAADAPESHESSGLHGTNAAVEEPPMNPPDSISSGPSVHGVRVEPTIEEVTAALDVESEESSEITEGGDDDSDSEDSDEGEGEEEEMAAAGGQPPIPRRDRAKMLFADLAEKHGVSVVAIGNGPAHHEIEELITEVIRENSSRLPGLRYAHVNEVAAIAYSSSVVGREEFPELDPGARCAISIGRRLQDPLRELVKVDPMHYGLGTGHHDFGGRMLKERLAEAVESCVNEVGADINAAHPWLLQNISGLNSVRARLITEHRTGAGKFTSREQLKELESITEDVFAQAAGFLRVVGGDEPLDETWIHPESYELARKILAHFGAEPSQLRDRATWSSVAEKLDAADAEELAKQFGSDVPTVWDILEFLARPGFDPRTVNPEPVLKTGLRQFEDLVEGQEIQGAVINIVDFGAFVDVGLKDCGLIHLSQMANRFVRSPHDLVTVGDIVTVWIIGLDLERKRVSLTMIPPFQRNQPREGQQRGRRDDRRQDHRQGGGQSDREGGGRRPPRQQQRNDRRSGPPKPREYNVNAKPKPKPQLTKEALEGKGVLHGFGELKAFFEAKKTKNSDSHEPAGEPPSEPTE